LKGYCLEDLETPGKLISFCDIDFIEDSSLSDLAVIDKIPLSPESINKLVDDTIFMDSTTSSLSVSNSTKVHLLESHLSTPPLSLLKSCCHLFLYQRKSLSSKIYPKESL